MPDLPTDYDDIHEPELVQRIKRYAGDPRWEALRTAPQLKQASGITELLALIDAADEAAGIRRVTEKDMDQFVGRLFKAQYHDRRQLLCPRCANGMPICAEFGFHHDQTCVKYRFTEDVCSECAAAMASEKSP